MKKPENKKKLGYKQFEGLLAEAHRKIEILSTSFHELQTFFIGYIEYNEDNVKVNSWMQKRLKELADEARRNDKANEPHLEGSRTD